MKKNVKEKRGREIMRKWQFTKQITSSCYFTYLRTEVNRWRKSASICFDKIQRGKKAYPIKTTTKIAASLSNNLK